MKQRSHSQRRGYSHAERARWVTLYRGSGLTQREFAANHGLKLGTLVQWLVKQRGNGSARPASFVEVPLGRVDQPASWVAELTWPSGLRVRLGAAAPKSWLGRVLKGGR